MSTDVDGRDEGVRVGPGQLSDQAGEAYFSNDRNLARTGETPRIHVMTVTQRLECITWLLDDGWQQHDRSLEVQIAQRLHRISRKPS